MDNIENKIIDIGLLKLKENLKNCEPAQKNNKTLQETKNYFSQYTL